MSSEPYAVHCYGDSVSAYQELRPELAEKFDDMYELRDAFDEEDWEQFPNIPEKAKYLEIITGPDALVYICASAMMPYNKPLWTKEELDDAIIEFGKYLFGDGTKLEPYEIFFTWDE